MTNEEAWQLHLAFVELNNAILEVVELLPKNPAKYADDLRAGLPTYSAEEQTA